MIGSDAPHSRAIPCTFPASGNGSAETGSQRTACTTTHRPIRWVVSVSRKDAGAPRAFWEDCRRGLEPRRDAEHKWPLGPRAASSASKRQGAASRCATTHASYPPQCRSARIGEAEQAALGGPVRREVAEAAHRRRRQFKKPRAATIAHVMSGARKASGRVKPSRRCWADQSVGRCRGVPPPSPSVQEAPSCNDRARDVRARKASGRVRLASIRSMPTTRAAASIEDAPPPVRSASTRWALPSSAARCGSAAPSAPVQDDPHPHLDPALPHLPRDIHDDRIGCIRRRTGGRAIACSLAETQLDEPVAPELAGELLGCGDDVGDDVAKHARRRSAALRLEPTGVGRQRFDRRGVGANAEPIREPRPVPKEPPGDVDRGTIEHAGRDAPSPCIRRSSLDQATGRCSTCNAVCSDGRASASAGHPSGRETRPAKRGSEQLGPAWRSRAPAASFLAPPRTAHDRRSLHARHHGSRPCAGPCRGRSGWRGAAVGDRRRTRGPRSEPSPSRPGSTGATSRRASRPRAHSLKASPGPPDAGRIPGRPSVRHHDNSPRTP